VRLRENDLSAPPKSRGEPVTAKRQLVDYIAEGNKPKADWRIGTEHEKFVYDLKTLRPVSYDAPNGIGALLHGLTRYGWEPIQENGKTIAMSQNGESITLEPATATRQVGGSQTYTATGNLEGGGTRNLTQRVVYSSSDPSIAAAPNQEGNRSLVQAVGVGTATISATDPETSIGSDASGGSAVLTVVAAGPTATPGGPTPSPTPVASCGDADGSGSVTVSDGVEVLGFAAALASDCSLAVCDVDGSGAVTVTDGVNVLRAAAELPATLRCAP